MKLKPLLFITAILVMMLQKGEARFLLVDVDGGEDVGLNTTPDKSVELYTSIDDSKCEWGPWQMSKCSKTCGGGKRDKHRVRQPKEGYDVYCGPRVDVKSEDCNTDPCPIDCIWGDWKKGSCSKSCGGGSLTYERIKVVKEDHGGTCEGEPTKVEDCNEEKCPLTGVPCCVEKGVPKECHGFCIDPEASDSRRLDYRSDRPNLCTRYKEIAAECELGYRKDKILGNWINEGACQDFGEGKICAALQLQVRSCQDGKTDKCTQQETFRLIPCRQDETENICDDRGHHCADEGQSCHCQGKVKYGLDQTWTEELVVEGSIQCSNEKFDDVVPGKRKECRCSPTNYNLVKSGVECKSADKHLGFYLYNASDCANACQDISECKYFISGTGSKEGTCYWEKTESRDCGEGWEEDQYNFFEMIRCKAEHVCCNPENKCGPGQGDCDSDNDCKAGLKCGRDNCGDMRRAIPEPYPNQGWDAINDCCY